MKTFIRLVYSLAAFTVGVAAAPLVAVAFPFAFAVLVFGESDEIMEET